MDCRGEAYLLCWLADLLMPMLPQLDEQSLTLEVNITSDSAKYIMRNLNWYHNGSLIQKSSNAIISDDNKTLTSINGSAGDYEVRYNGLLLFYRYNENCEKMILNNLRHYPLFKPAKFLVNTKGMDSSNCSCYNSIKPLLIE